MNARIRKKQLRQQALNQLNVNLKQLDSINQKIAETELKIKKAKAILNSKKATFSQIQEQLNLVKRLNKEAWKNLNVNGIIGKKNYTEGQKNYVRAIQTIENRLGKVAADLKLKYGSDDIEELANQYYIAGLSSYSEDELRAIETEFNKTHGYQVRLEKATNPFANIDFLSM